MRGFIVPLWFLISAIFAYLAYMHWRLSETPLRLFDLREEGGPGSGEETGEVQLSEKSIGDFNNYLEMTNRKYRSQHRVSAIGYFIAVFLGLASLFLMSGTT